MKKIITALLFAQILFSCNNKNEDKQQTDNQEIITAKDNNVQNSVENPATEKSTFDINSISISTADIGDFPFFSAPEGSVYINKPKVSNFDFIVFTTSDDVYEVEGKTFRSYVHPDRENGSEISGRFLLKSYEDAILKACGVKVFEGKLSKNQKDKYEELATYAGSDGSIDIYNNPIITYVIRRNDGNVYIAIDKSNGNSTAIQIVQEKPFQQTIQKISSTQIEKDLTNKGKSVLHINFDTNKATLKQDGLEAVQEIIKVLNTNKGLKIAINGHTDNSGSKERNQKLSEERAFTVKNEIIKSGINAERLTSKGFGQDNPIEINETEDGKSKNRRVELIKM